MSTYRLVKIHAIIRNVRSQNLGELRSLLLLSYCSSDGVYEKNHARKDNSFFTGCDQDFLLKLIVT